MSVQQLKGQYVLFLIDLVRKAPSEASRVGLYERIERTIASQPEVPVSVKPIVYPVVEVD